MNTSYSFVDTIYNLKKNDAIFLSDLAYAISDRHIGKLNEFSTKHCDGNYVVAGLIIDNFAQAVAEGYTYWEVKQCTLRVRFSEELHTKIDTGRADFSHNCYSKVTTIKTICSLTNCGLKQCKDALKLITLTCR